MNRGDTNEEAGQEHNKPEEGTPQQPDRGQSSSTDVGENQRPRHSIFFSLATTDWEASVTKNFITAIRDELEKRGFLVFIARAKLTPEWQVSVLKALKESQATVVFLSEDSVRSPFVLTEVWLSKHAEMAEDPRRKTFFVFLPSYERRLFDDTVLRKEFAANRNPVSKPTAGEAAEQLVRLFGSEDPAIKPTEQWSPDSARKARGRKWLRLGFFLALFAGGMLAGWGFYAKRTLGNRLSVARLAAYVEAKGIGRIATLRGDVLRLSFDSSEGDLQNLENEMTHLGITNAAVESAFQSLTNSIARSSTNLTHLDQWAIDQLRGFHTDYQELRRALKDGFFFIQLRNNLATSNLPGSRTLKDSWRAAWKHFYDNYDRQEKRPLASYQRSDLYPIGRNTHGHWEFAWFDGWTLGASWTDWGSEDEAEVQEDKFIGSAVFVLVDAHPMLTNQSIDPFFVGIWEVSKAFWSHLGGRSVTNSRTPESASTTPITGVSWNDIRQILNLDTNGRPSGWLDLPTAREWDTLLELGGHRERAMLNGLALGFDDRNKARLVKFLQSTYYYATGETNQPLAVNASQNAGVVFKRDDLGLHHLIGNVWEWCRKSSDTNNTVRLLAPWEQPVRGASFYADRALEGQNYDLHGFQDVGFRVILHLPGYMSVATNRAAR